MSGVQAALIGVRHGLRFVIEVRKDEAAGLRLLLETGGTVGGVGGRIVAADGDDAEGFAGIVLAQRCQAFLDVLDVGAVGADEHDQQRLLAAEVVAADGLAGYHVGERKVRRNGAQFEHGGFGKCHWWYLLSFVDSERGA